jgi:hypothetical protein
MLEIYDRQDCLNCGLDSRNFAYVTKNIANTLGKIIRKRIGGQHDGV